MFLVFAICLSLQVFLTTSKVIPDRLPQPCSRSTPDYNECMLQFFRKIGVEALKGIPELNIPSMNPLFIPTISANRTISDIASVAGTVRNVKIFGLKNTQLNDFKFDFETMTGEGEVFAPHIRETFEYEARGKLLSPVLIKSSGYCKANVTDATLYFKFSLKPIERLGVKYYTFDTYKIKIKIGDVHVKVISSNPEEQGIADFVANFINDDFQRLLDVFQGVLEEAMEVVSGAIFEQLLQTVPANEIIPE